MFYSSPQLTDWPKQRQILQKWALIPTRFVDNVHIIWDLHFNQCTNRPCFLQCVYISIRDDICTHLPFYTLYVFLHGKIAPNALFCYWVLMMATSSSSSINAIFFTYWVSCQWFDIFEKELSVHCIFFLGLNNNEN